MSSPFHTKCDVQQSATVKRTEVPKNAFINEWTAVYLKKDGTQKVGAAHNKAARAAIQERLKRECDGTANLFLQALRLQKKFSKAPSGKSVATVILNGVAMTKEDFAAFIDDIVKRVKLLHELHVLGAKRITIKIDELTPDKMKGRHAPFPVLRGSRMHLFGEAVEGFLKQQFGNIAAPASLGLFTQATFDGLFRWYYMTKRLCPGYFPRGGNQADYLIPGNVIAADDFLAEFWPQLRTPKGQKAAANGADGLMDANGCFAYLAINSLPKYDRVQISGDGPNTLAALLTQDAAFYGPVASVFSGQPEVAETRNFMIGQLIAQTQYLSSPTNGLIVKVRNSPDYLQADAAKEAFKKRVAADEAATPQGQQEAAQKEAAAKQAKKVADAQKKVLIQNPFFTTVEKARAPK